MKQCHAQRPDINVLGKKLHCIRTVQHSGHHVAMDLVRGHLITWIEPERLRGAALMTEDDRPVISPSDPRHFPSPDPAARPKGRWHRFIAWIKPTALGR